MTKRKDGRWQDYIVKDGKRIFFYGKTKAEVTRKIKWFNTERVNKTIEAVCNEFWNDHEATLAESSKKGYISNLKRIKEKFGKIYIEDITPVHISAFLGELKNKYSAKTLSMQLMVFRLIYQYAISNGYCQSNPAKDIKAPLGKGKKKRTVPSSDAISIVKSSTDCTFGMFLYWVMYTGVRRGELLALRWEDVNFAEKTIYISKTVYYVSNVPHIKEPKTEAGVRFVPLLNALSEKINPKRSGLIFPDPVTGDLMTYKHFESLWAKYVKESHLPPHSTPHSFRHLFATMLYEAEIPAEQAQIILGHAQLSTTMDIYRGIRQEMQKKTCEKIYTIDIK